MIRMSFVVAAFVGAALFANGAVAKKYTDYTPEKGMWRINAVEVDPNHVDDYLTGLRRSQVPEFEIMKKRGIIDDYRYIVRDGYLKGSPNILIETHFTSVAMMAPDRERDEAIDREVHAQFSEADGKAAIAGYEKYRTFVDNGLWHEVTIAK